MSPLRADLLTCEHASNAVPPGLLLGVDAALLASHTAWDPGAHPVAQALALAWGAPLHAGQVTRLVVDLNRSPERDAAIPAVAFGSEIPGNADLSLDERARRLAAFHAPYRRAVRADAALLIERRGACRHLSIHSFTPELHGQVRDFDLGLLYDPARGIEVAWVADLYEGLARAGFSVRHNEPYAGTGDGLTTWMRSQLLPSQYAGVELEISQRLSAADRERLTDALRG